MKKQPGQDIEKLLHEAGARWRTRQVFGRIAIAPGKRMRSGATRSGIGGFATSLLGITAVAAMALAVASVAPAWLAGGGGQVGPTATEDGIASPVTIDSSPVASPGDISAAQLPVIQAVNADPANFGGVYIDSDGTLVIQYVGANAGRAAVDKVIGVGVAVRWVKVERSETELDRILRDIQARQLEGVSMIAVDTINNRVDVYVHAPATTDAVSAALGVHGDAVNVVLVPQPPMIQPAIGTQSP